MQSHDLEVPVPRHEGCERQQQQAVQQEQHADQLPRGITIGEALAEDRLRRIGNGGQETEGDSAHGWMLGSGERGCKRLQSAPREGYEG